MSGINVRSLSQAEGIGESIFLEDGQTTFSGCPGRRSIGSGPWSLWAAVTSASADAVTGAVLADPETHLPLIGTVFMIIGMSAANV